MTEALYLNDSYLREWDAEVKTVTKGKYVTLDKTAFFPRGGGVEHDTGVITTKNKEEFKVVYTGKFSGDISHEVDKEGLTRADKIHCELNWDRRYLLMRYHTAIHVLSGVFYREYNLKVTGNQLTTEKGRLDLNMKEMNVDLIKEAIEKSNKIIQKKLPVKIYYKSREEAEKDTVLFKLAMGFPHDIETIRIVEIEGFDRQADGGCHVKNLGEIGKIKFKDAVNKGRDNKRIYFTI